MTPIPAKVLTVAKQSSQYRILVQIELEKYLGSFHTLRFGEKKPFTGSCHHGQLDLFYYRDPGLKAGKAFPLWTIMWLYLATEGLGATTQEPSPSGTPKT